jgi:hypothetical protein
MVCPVEKELMTYDQLCLLLVHSVESLATLAVSACHNKEFQGGADSVDIAFYFRVYKFKSVLSIRLLMIFIFVYFVVF